MATAAFSHHHIEAATRGLSAARIRQGLGQGLFAATAFNPAHCRPEITTGDSQANDENYSLAWVRDTLKCSVYDRVAGHHTQVQQMMDALLAYFRQHVGLMERAIATAAKGQQLHHQTHAILPRLHPLTLEPVHADQSKDLQLDMAEILTHLALAARAGAFRLQTPADWELIQTLLRYFLAWDYGFNSEIPGDFGIWEEGIGGTRGKPHPDLHSSSIAAMLAGYRNIQGATFQLWDSAQSFPAIAIDSAILERGFTLLNTRIETVGETTERPYDLTHLIILYDHLLLQDTQGQGLLTPENEQTILQAMGKLERDRGFVRYASDENPDGLDDYHKGEKGKSAEWPLGFCYAALIYDQLGQQEQALAYIQKAEAAFDWQRGMGLPEAYFGGSDRPVPVSPLSWANALYLVMYENWNWCIDKN